MSPTPPRRPLVVVVGATGTGKSQLAVSLAEHHNGEIINGDALQMYEGLPITTNKISTQEMKGVPHHLLGCVKLGEDPWTIHQFCTRASSIIQGIRSRGKLPILVGGTHYYLQSLVFPKSLVEDDSLVEHLDEKEEERKWPILAADCKEMLDELRRVDPDIAQTWHPQDRRKIRRSLQIWLQTGRRASEVYNGQKEDLLAADLEMYRRLDGTINAAMPHAHDPIIFWTYSSPPMFNERLDNRVDSMVSNGLLEEAQSMSSYLHQQTQQGNAIDDSRGIWIAIGFKEMLPYITNSHATEKEKDECVERTKISTRQYARRQNRWIHQKLLYAAKQARVDGKVYLLDSTDAAKFSSNVESVARTITSSFLAGDELPEPKTLSDAAKEMLLLKPKETRHAYYCEACDKTMMSEPDWLGHLNSKGHKRATTPKVDWKALYPKKEEI